MINEMVVPFVAIAVLWYFLLLRPQRRERKKRDASLKELKKNDRVVTIGGIVGTIANISQDSREVTLKIDDNARITVLRNSIQGPYQKGDEQKDSK
ncbi:MAG: preprotein translocase subunit YajC [Planctomycetes bacterium]|nr:preprotein translocase subunit YajC [Planctomycetota bacterium]